MGDKKRQMEMLIVSGKLVKWDIVTCIMYTFAACGDSDVRYENAERFNNNYSMIYALILFLYFNI